MFDKLHHVNGSDSAIKATDTDDSTKPMIVKEKPNLRKLNNGVKLTGIDDWNSLAQFEKRIDREMENLAAAKRSQQQSNGVASPVSTKTNNGNILKPEKHVRSLSRFNSMIFLCVLIFP